MSDLPCFYSSYLYVCFGNEKVECYMQIEITAIKSESLGM